jgi:probable HAF family extracellular repeat protein
MNGQVAEGYSLGINNLGQIVGTYRDFGGTLHGFLDTNGVITTIDFPGFDTSVTAINDSGQIVGAYFTRDDTQAFLDSGGVFTTLNAEYSTGINDSGQIVGLGLLGPGGPSFLYSSGLYTSIDANAEAINNKGEITGASGNQVFLLDGTNFILLRELGIAFGINNSGQLVGDFTRGSGLLDSSGLFTPIDYPGATSTLPTGINDSGVIVGIYSSSSAALPEPSELLPLALLLTFMGFFLRRRRVSERRNRLAS